MSGSSELGKRAQRLNDSDVEVGRTARRAMWHIVRQAGRPGAEEAKKAAVSQLIALLSADQPAVVYREVLWMLSEIGGDESVDSIAALLSSKTAREDARMALERIPGDKSLAALTTALASAPDDFRPAIAQSLRARNVKVSDPPCRKLVPTKQTRVKPVDIAVG